MNKNAKIFIYINFILLFSNCSINHDKISSQSERYLLKGKEFKPSKYVARSMNKEKAFMTNYFLKEGIDTFYSFYVSYCDSCKFYSRYYFFYQHNGKQFLKYYYNDPNNWSIIREKEPVSFNLEIISQFFSLNQEILIVEEDDPKSSHEILKYELVWIHLGKFYSKNFYSGTIDKNIGNKLDFLAVTLEKAVYPNIENIKKQKNLSKEHYK